MVGLYFILFIRKSLFQYKPASSCLDESISFSNSVICCGCWSGDVAKLAGIGVSDDIYNGVGAMSGTGGKSLSPSQSCCDIQIPVERRWISLLQYVKSSSFYYLLIYSIGFIPRISFNVRYIK